MENINDNENFKRWFKNSKAVNSDGTPMILYHQTNKDNEESRRDLLMSASKMDIPEPQHCLEMGKHEPQPLLEPMQYKRYHEEN